MGLPKQSSSKMKALLVLTVVSCASAAPQLLGYPYAYGTPLTYTYTPQVTKLVPKEVEVPVETLQYAVKETGCTNVFGFAVPCLAEGEARRKRSADEEAEVKAAPVLSYAGLPFAYAGYPYAHYPYVAPTYAVTEPKVTEVEIPQIVYKPV